MKWLDRDFSADPFLAERPFYPHAQDGANPDWYRATARHYTPPAVWPQHRPTVREQIASGIALTIKVLEALGGVALLAVLWAITEGVITR